MCETNGIVAGKFPEVWKRPFRVSLAYSQDVDTTEDRNKRPCPALAAKDASFFPYRKTPVNAFSAAVVGYLHWLGFHDDV